MTILETLRGLGYEPLQADFYSKIAEWNSWYIGNVARFHRYKIRTGAKSVNCKRYSLGMGKKVAEDWAGLLLNERTRISIADEKAQALVDQVLTENNFSVRGNEMQEIKFALGTAAYIPSVVERAADGSGGRITIDYVSAPHIWPLSWRNGVVTECAFDSAVTADGKDYVYLQIHKLDGNGTYIIENRLYRTQNGNVSEVHLDEVPGFENVPREVFTGSAERQFVIDRPNIANNYDITNPMGVAVFANAIDAMESVDIAFDGFVWDFMTGKRRLFITPTAASYIDGEPVFDPQEVAFYVLPEDVSDKGNAIQTTGGTFAVSDTTVGVQTALNVLSSKCGFGENHYRFDRGGIATATQVISENSTLFRTVKKHEIILHDVLVELCRIILRLANTALDAGVDEDAEISIEFDDSIIEDKQSERNNDRMDLAAGVMNPWEYRVKWYNETEEEAKANLPGMEFLTTEPQFEIGAPAEENREAIKEVEKTAEDVAGKTLNGAQTQSLISIIAQMQAGNLSEGQAINMISIAIGVTKEEAAAIIRGE